MSKLSVSELASEFAVPSAVELGAAVGREQTAVVGILDRHLAAGVHDLVSAPPRGANEEDV